MRGAAFDTLRPPPPTTSRCMMWKINSSRSAALNRSQSSHPSSKSNLRSRSETRTSPQGTSRHLLMSPIRTISCSSRRLKKSRRKTVVASRLNLIAPALSVPSWLHPADLSGSVVRLLQPRV